MVEAARSGILGMMISQRQSSNPGDNRPLAMPEDDFCRRLCAYGETIGMLVFLFCASQAAAASAHGMRGYRLENGQWREDRFPLPDVVYDRALPTSAAQARQFREALRQLQLLKRFIPLNGSLPGKLDVYTAMRDETSLRQWLPETHPYEAASGLEMLIRHYPKGLFLKPSAGMHGKGALRLLPSEDGWRLDGRDRQNRSLSRRFTDWSALSAWIHRFASASSYLVQPCLDLTDGQGRPFDVRALMQKDDRGRWSFTGAAVRRGQPGSVTSNLHGGGAAEIAQEALSAQYGNAAAKKLLEQIRRVGENAAVCLERHFGRLAELGLDFGLEPHGRLWLLEANAKPGRQSFDGDLQTAKLAVRRPLQYALLLASRQSPVFPFTSIQRRYIQEVHP